MSRIPDGGCQLRNCDIQDGPVTTQNTLHLLKDQGAPIVGMCVLQLDHDYEWFTEQNQMYCSTVYKWRLKNR